MELEVILIMVFPTWREMGSEAGSQSGRHSKEVHVHTLRHTYATHLLEDGMDIITLKDL
jgi:site-specific recombinase XerD